MAVESLTCMAASGQPAIPAWHLRPSGNNGKNSVVAAEQRAPHGH
jgi:hypothetical protein